MSGVNLVNRGKGATVGAHLKMLRIGGRSKELAQALHVQVDHNVPSAWRTNLEITGEELTDGDVEMVLAAMAFAVPMDDEGVSLPPWIKWVGVAIVVGLVAAFVLGRL